MKVLTAEWLAKAEADWNTGGVVFRSRKWPDYDHACFHAQQCAEKYMKALLMESGKPVPRTHDLESLLDILPEKDEKWEALRPSLGVLSEAAVTSRYPGEFADKAAAKKALATAGQVRSLARKQLHLAV
jgi:HEPN domain-containing protein